MEISDYMRHARRRLWVLIVVPILAAGAALAYVLTTPPTYSATATVLSPSLVGTSYSQFNGPQAINQFVSTFTASASDPTVLSQTADETGTSVSDLILNANIAQVGASSNMTITYSGPKRATSSKIAEALARNALRNIYASQEKVNQAQLVGAKKAFDAANKAVSDYAAKVRVGNPPAAYQAALSQVAWLQQTQANYAAVGNGSSARAIQPTISAAQRNATAIGALLPPYNTLLTAQGVASSSYQSVLNEQRSAQAQAAAAADPRVVQVGVPTRDLKTASIVRLVVPVFGAALLLAIMVVALIGFVGALRRQASVHSPVPPTHRASRATRAQSEGVPSKIGA